MKSPNFVILIALFVVLSTLMADAKFHKNLKIDKRPCGKQIDKCIRETRNTELGGCLGTAYGLYFAGEEGVSNCKNGIYTPNCLTLDQAAAISQCFHLGTFPDSCTSDVSKCVANFEMSAEIL